MTAWLPHFFLIPRFTQQGTFEWLTRGVKRIVDGKMIYRNEAPHWEEWT